MNIMCSGIWMVLQYLLNKKLSESTECQVFLLKVHFDWARLHPLALLVPNLLEKRMLKYFLYLYSLPGIKHD